MERETIYRACRAILGEKAWAASTAGAGQGSAPEEVPLRLAQEADRGQIPSYLADLAALEWAVFSAGAKAPGARFEAETILLNPTLSLVTTSFKNLADLLEKGVKPAKDPEPGEERMLVWSIPDTKEVRLRVATEEDLLVLKMVEEHLGALAVAGMGGLPVRAIREAMDRAAAKGLVLYPQTRLRRGGVDAGEANRPFMSADRFTLQWHVTQRCELSCSHCYDRTDRRELPLGRALGVLEDLEQFCEEKHVRGAVTFTGGNPLLYPPFASLYKAAVERGFSVAILGNPTQRSVLQRLLDIGKPDFFQVSLEGLEGKNDRVRGPGHFRRTLAFLEVLKDLGVYSMVMLTLTRENMEDVLPLARALQGKADVFHFNRLSRSGRGAELSLPAPEEYRSFLEAYAAASKELSIMGLKDNLLNLVLTAQGEAPFGGCTGFGCGAAFNFMSLLPDGQVHACRKFPSPLGNILSESLSAIYDSKGASRYRQRPAACSTCSLGTVCGGCLAVIQTHGLDISRDRDPFCFL